MDDSTDGEVLETVTIAPSVVAAARGLDKQIEENRLALPKDAAAELIQRLKGYKPVAIAIVAVIVLTAIVTLANQATELIWRLAELWHRKQ